MNELKLYLILLLSIILTNISLSQSVVINEVMSSNTITLKDNNGNYPDWIEIYNNSDNPINLNGYGLSDNDLLPFKWVFPNGTLGTYQYIVVFASGVSNTSDFQNLHTNFKIKQSGEPISLTDPNGNLIDHIVATVIPSDVSLGRQPDGSTNWFYFSNGEATPGSSNNNASGTSGLTDPPVFSNLGGFYSGSVTISLILSLPQTTIYYSTNGSEPTEQSQVYTSSITLTKTTVIRAKAFQVGKLASKTITNTYLINERNTLPVISISTDSANFFDENTGIYVSGPNAAPPNPNNPDSSANYWQDWEKPIHIEMYEPDGTQAFSIDAGIKIHGGYSREYLHKSFAIFARGKYGYNEIKYKIFPDLAIDKFQAFVLRNSGQDWTHTMFRDAMMESLVKETGLDIRAYRPAVLFLNGEYWGIFNIREKENEHYLASHHGVDPNNVTRLELDGTAKQGDPSEYKAMYNFIKNNDMSVTSNYEYIKTQMDVNNFITYMVSEIYFNNVDWPGSNIKYWKSNTSDSKWKWILQDTDFGFGLYDRKSTGEPTDGYKHQTLDFATTTNGSSWPNPPWSTVLLRKLLQNQEFKTNFINTFVDFSNTYFVPQTVVDRINQMKSVIESEMPYHLEKWHTYEVANYKLYSETMADWYYNVQKMIDFANNRLPHIRNNYVSKFNLSGTSKISLTISQVNTGKVKINSVTVDQPTWSGVYFNDVPITVEAIPVIGYEFVGWSGESTSSSNKITLTLNSDVNLTANFQLMQNTNYSVSGNILYDNTLSNPLPNVTVKLTSSNGGNSITTTTDANGDYSFNNVATGNYNLTATTSAQFPKNYINATDALLVLRYFAGLQTLNPLRLAAADVDNLGGVNATDALVIIRRFAGLISVFTKPDWIFETKQISVTNSNLTSQNIKGIATGDVDGSATGPY
ncbi:MAG: CotH kinase family protein [Bacteroidetes bacterium]|nr:CotH kinase family protein [Bacteroidota bacterium]